MLVQRYMYELTSFSMYATLAYLSLAYNRFDLSEKRFQRISLLASMFSLTPCVHFHTKFVAGTGYYIPTNKIYLVKHFRVRVLM